MKAESDILKEIKYLTHLKSERFNDFRLSVLAKNNDYGKVAPANLKAIRKRNISAGDPTLSAHGRFQDDFPGIKDSYIDKYNANRWRGYLICEGPDPHPKKKDTAIQRFIENVLVNPNHYEIDITTLLIVGSATDKLPEYDNVEAFADYISQEYNYGPYTLKPIKPENDKSTKHIKHIRLNIKQSGKEIKEVDIYQILKIPVLKASRTLFSSIENDIVLQENKNDLALLQEIAQSDSKKIAAHDATGLDYAAALILSFYYYQHFSNLIDEDNKISEKFLKDLKKLNNARPGAIQNGEQFVFAIKLAFELYQVKLDHAISKFSKADKKVRSHVTPPNFIGPLQLNEKSSENRVNGVTRRATSGSHLRMNVRFAQSAGTLDVNIYSESPKGKKVLSTDLVSEDQSKLDANDLINRKDNGSTIISTEELPVYPKASSPKNIPDSSAAYLKSFENSTSAEPLDLRSDELSSSPECSESLSDKVLSPSGSPRISKRLEKVRLVCIIGSLDTKPTENEMLRKLLISKGFAAFVIDVGTFEPKSINYPIDVKTKKIVKAAGYDIKLLRIEKQRPKAVVAVKAGLSKMIIELNNKYDFDAVIGMGGTNGTDIVTTAMQQLPESIPKICITTVAGQKTWEYTQGSRIFLFDAITDIGGGVNSILAQVIENAVCALAGMVVSPKININQKEAPKKPTIVTSKFGVTTPAVDASAEALQKQGYNVLQFHMVGTGGKNMETLIRNGAVKGCLDITLAEITSLLDHGVWSAGSSRLSAAIDMGIPQVISLGAMDMTMLNKEALDDPRHAGRTIYKCNPDVFAMRNGMPQYDSFARFIINKLQHAKAPVILLIPKKGLSKFDYATYDEKLKEEIPSVLPNIDAPDDRSKDIIWHDPYANQFFFSLITSLAAVDAPHIPVIELDCHINDPIFAQVASKLMLLALTINEQCKENYIFKLAKVCEYLRGFIKKEKVNDFVDLGIDRILQEANNCKLPFQVLLSFTIQERFKDNVKPMLLKARELLTKLRNDAKKNNDKSFDINHLEVEVILKQIITQVNNSIPGVSKQIETHPEEKRSGSEITRKVMPHAESAFNLPGLLFTNHEVVSKSSHRRHSAHAYFDLERANGSKVAMSSSSEVSNKNDHKHSP